MLSPDRVYVGTSEDGTATMAKPRTTITTAEAVKATTDNRHSSTSGNNNTNHFTTNKTVGLTAHR